MSDHKFIYRACCFAITKLIENGSTSFATKIDGRWITKDWLLILEELNNLLVKDVYNRGFYIPDNNVRIDKTDENYESCLNCIHADDTEEMCLIRRCKHAICHLKECYISKD